MDERRLRKIFHFNDDDLLTNRRGLFSASQTKRLAQRAMEEKASARSSAGILFVIAAAGLAIGLTISAIAPNGVGRIAIFLLMGLLWPIVWGGRGIGVIRSANILQNPALRSVSGIVRLVHHGNEDHMLQVGEIEFDLDGNVSGALVDGDNITMYYLEATQEILTVEPKG